MLSVVRHLVHRRVPQVVGIYLAASWGTIEFTDWATGRLGWPPSVLRWVLTILVLGLPVALALTWYLSGSREAVPEHPPAPPRSLAVLPFSGFGDDTEYLAVGLADQIIMDLARVGDLTVAARTSSFAYRDSHHDVREIGRRLGVRAVLEGSVQRSGNRLRVNTQLVSVEDGYQLWTERFDRTVDDIFRIEDEIAANVARVLEAILHEHELRALTKIPTREIRAFEFYTRGREFLLEVRQRRLCYAREMFEKALAIDQDFALAHAGIAHSIALECMYYPESANLLERAESASLRALSLDPESAEAHSAHGMVLLADERIDEAEQAFVRARELDPQLYDAWYFHGRACFQTGRFAHAARLFRRASELHADYSAKFFAAQAEEALGDREKSRPTYESALKSVERYMEMHPEDPRAATMRAVALERLGHRDDAVYWAGRAIESDPDDCSVRYNVACLFSLAGETDRALECLGEAVHGGFGNPAWLAKDPDLDPIRDDPRFEALLRRPTHPFGHGHAIDA